MDPENKGTLSPDEKLMFYVLVSNGMWPLDEKARAKGKSIDDPIIIDLEEGYVRAEYLVAGLLLYPRKNELAMQSLMEKDGRKYDTLAFHVTEEDGTEHHESFIFDITVGYDAL
jgi:hypothetical protein